MSNVEVLLDKAAKACSPANYNALAARMKVSRSLVSAWKTGKFPIPQDRVAEIARIAHEKPSDWLPKIESEQSTGEARKGWEEVIKRLGIAAGIVTMLGALPLPGHALEQAGTRGSSCNSLVMPIMSRLRRQLARILCWDFGFTPRTRTCHGPMLALQG